MRRREFIKALAGSATAWPLAVRAQQRERMRRIEVLLPATSDDPEFQARVGAFLQGLQQSGWAIGQNVRIDTRWATSDAAAIRKHAAELAALAPDVILAHGASTVGPLLQIIVIAWTSQSIRPVLQRVADSNAAPTPRDSRNSPSESDL